jgi:hypothetical protein
VESSSVRFDMAVFLTKCVDYFCYARLSGADTFSIDVRHLTLEDVYTFVTPALRPLPALLSLSLKDVDVAPDFFSGLASATITPVIVALSLSNVNDQSDAMSPIIPISFLARLHIVTFDADDEPPIEYLAQTSHCLLDFNLTDNRHDLLQLFKLPTSFRLTFAWCISPNPLDFVISEVLGCLDLLNQLLASAPSLSSLHPSSFLFSSPPTSPPSRVLILPEPFRQKGPYSIDLLPLVEGLLELCAQQNIDVEWDPIVRPGESLVSPAFERWVRRREQAVGQTSDGTRT